MDLKNRKCKACDGETRALSPDAAQAFRAQVPKWKIRKDAPRLWREYTFKDFARAIKFINKVAEIAEAENHHPDIHIRSEEHTSELQSPDHLVCRLLLEK